MGIHFTRSPKIKRAPNKTAVSALMQPLFWSQYAEAGHPVPLSDQLKQLVELHKAAEQALKGFIVRLWPGRPCLGATSDWCGGWWRLDQGSRSLSARSASKVPVGPLPVQRCTGVSWMVRSL